MEIEKFNSFVKQLMKYINEQYLDNEMVPLTGMAVDKDMKILRTIASDSTSDIGKQAFRINLKRICKTVDSEYAIIIFEMFFIKQHESDNSGRNVRPSKRSDRREGVIFIISNRHGICDYVKVTEIMRDKKHPYIVETEMDGKMDKAKINIFNESW